MYDDGLPASWQPRENFFDDNGDVNEVFQAFEANAPNEDEPKTLLKRPLSPASKAIYDHTSSLSDRSVASSEVGSAEEIVNVNKKIKSITKKEIRESTINRREEDKNQIASGIKSQLASQEQAQQFSQLIQLQGLKLLQKLMDEPEEENKLQKDNDKKIEVVQREVETVKLEINGINNKVTEMNTSLTQILTLLQNKNQ